MSHSSDDSCNELSGNKQQSQNQQVPPSDKIINASEIEKLYLRIKEDWL